MQYRGYNPFRMSLEILYVGQLKRPVPPPFLMSSFPSAGERVFKL